VCKNIDFFDYAKLVRFDFSPPKFFNSVFLYGNYKAVAKAQNKHFNFLTDYLEHGVCFINTIESARLLGYVDRKFIKNIYTYGPIRQNLIQQYLQKHNLKRNVIEVGPYILGAKHFYKPDKLAALKNTYGKILLVYPQHSIETRVVHYELDDIIREIHKGNLEGNETYPYKVKKRLMEESQGRIMISLSAYKYSEEEAALAVEEYEHRWDKPFI
jgi:hypothetical protein